MTSKNWIPVRSGSEDPTHYCVRQLDPHADSMAALRDMFDGGRADGMNLCLFSTSGVHGTYNSIEDAERAFLGQDGYTDRDVTFVIIQPRRVSLWYGNCRPESLEDFTFLRNIRGTTLMAMCESFTSDEPIEGKSAAPSGPG